MSTPTPRCTRNSCQGVALEDSGTCLAHADPTVKSRALTRFGAGGKLDFVKGVRIEQDLLKEIKAAAPVVDGRPEFRDADFTNCHFTGVADFDNVRFTGKQARFWEASFEDVAGFRDSLFQVEAVFSSVTFQGLANFERVVFESGVALAGTFESRALFTSIQVREGIAAISGDFGGVVSFSYARFAQGLQSMFSHFRKDVFFLQATAAGWTTFHGARFEERFDLSAAVFDGNLDLDACSFGTTPELGPLLISGSLNLQGSEFDDRVNIRLAALGLSLVRTQFRNGADLRVCRAMMNLRGCDCRSPTSISDFSVLQPEFTYRDDTVCDSVWQSHFLPVTDRRPALLTLESANLIGTLALTGVGLERCRFSGVLALESLHVGPRVTWVRPPRTWRWTQRRVIAEEAQWRKGQERWQSDWRPFDDAEEWIQLTRETHDPPSPYHHPAHQASDKDTQREPDPDELASLYRHLRKGREDEGDAPGAADFYYGEMEMRRFAAQTSLAEKFIISLYWLVSGYALRAWRAVVALLVVVVLAAIVFSAWGFEQPTKPSSHRDIPGGAGVQPRVRNSFAARRRPASDTHWSVVPDCPPARRPHTLRPGIAFAERTHEALAGIAGRPLS